MTLTRNRVLAVAVMAALLAPPYALCITEFHKAEAIKSSPRVYGYEEIYDRSTSAVAEVFVQQHPDDTRLDSGTGFFVSEDGLMITAYHVVYDKDRPEDSPFIFIRCPGNIYYLMNVVRANKEHDLVLLKAASRFENAPNNAGPVEPRLVDINKKFDFLKFSSLRPLKAGEPISTVGYPSIFASVLSIGVVASPEFQVVPVRGDSTVYKDLVVANVQLFPGNSGGPILDRYGLVIGVATLGSEARKFCFFQQARYAESLLKG